MQLFFFNDTATTEIYTLSLHDALPILPLPPEGVLQAQVEEHRALAVAGPDADRHGDAGYDLQPAAHVDGPDRKSTRLNSSHANISYAVFCLKKKIYCRLPSSFLLGSFT